MHRCDAAVQPTPQGSPQLPQSFQPPESVGLRKLSTDSAPAPPPGFEQAGKDIPVAGGATEAGPDAPHSPQDTPESKDKVEEKGMFQPLNIAVERPVCLL